MLVLIPKPELYYISDCSYQFRGGILTELSLLTVKYSKVILIFTSNVYSFLYGHGSACTFYLFIFLGVLRRFQHCTGHIRMGSWKGRGNQYIQFVRVLYCKLLTNGKQLPAFPLEAVPGTEPRPQRWEARVLPPCHRGPCFSMHKRPPLYRDHHLCKCCFAIPIMTFCIYLYLYIKTESLCRPVFSGWPLYTTATELIVGPFIVYIRGLFYFITGATVAEW